MPRSPRGRTAAHVVAPIAVAVALFAAAFSLVPAGRASAALPPDAEQLLRDRFVGTFVRVKLDMPANQKGIDVWPAQTPGVDYAELARRLKLYGTSLRRGDEVQVTKVKVKKDLVEFQLGGGGYGTFGDETGDVGGTPTVGKSQREKNLEQDLKRTSDPAKRRAIEEELDQLRRERAREDAANQAAAEDASEARREGVRSRAAESGSRFNVRFRETVPASALEVEGLMAALDDYLIFDTDTDAGSASADGAPPATGVAALRKGMTRAEAEAALGAPTKATPAKEGSLQVERLVFATAGEQVDALFVEGVLVRYTVTSK